MKPILFIFSGLPGVGKTSLARRVAREYGAAYLRIDTIEQALRELCRIEVRGEGYRLAYRIAADNLKTGRNVVADSCNPVELTRREWENVAMENGAAFLNIEITCSNREEHRHRVETRKSDISGLKLPDWQEIESHYFDQWSSCRITLDTTGCSVRESFEALNQKIIAQWMGS